MEALKLISKRLNLMIAVMIFCFAVCILTIIFYKPHTEGDATAVNKALEEQRQAVTEQRTALKDLSKQAEKTIEYLTGRDSALNGKYNKTIDSINKLRSNEKLNSYNNYGSADLQRAFADLEKGR